MVSLTRKERPLMDNTRTLLAAPTDELKVMIEQVAAWAPAE